MHDFIKMMVYALLGIVYYFIGLRAFNKGKKNIVNLDAGRLQLYAILTAIIGLGMTYYFFNSALTSLLGIMPIPLMARARGKTYRLIDIIDGRGTAGKKFDKILIVAFGIVIGFWLLHVITSTSLISISPYLPAILIMLLGFWMIGNKEDALTKWGYGVLAVGVLAMLMQMSIW